MKYNKNEVTGKMRDRIILQNVTRVRSLTGFASEIWTDTTTIWAFAESKLPGSNETIIEGKNTAKNICDFTIRYISSITEESRVVFKNKIYQVKNIKISHDRRFISFQGVYYDSYSTVIGLQFCSASLLAQSSLSAALMRVIKYQASLNAFGSVSADIALVQKVASSLNAFGTLTGDITFVKKAQASLLTSSSVTGNIIIPKLVQASLTGAGTTAANLTVNAPSASLLLDLYPNAAVAYSLRKLRTAYTGSAIRVRANTSGAEGDVSFDVNNTISASSTVTVTAVGTSGLSIGQQVTFSTFWNAGGSNQNVFVTTWYDQSGNAQNATMSTQANQPQIVSSGVVVTQNGKPALQYDGTNDGLNATVTGINNTTDLCLFYAYSSNLAAAANTNSAYLWWNGDFNITNVRSHLSSTGILSGEYVAFDVRKSPMSQERIGSTTYRRTANTLVVENTFFLTNETSFQQNNNNITLDILFGATLSENLTPSAYNTSTKLNIGYADIGVFANQKISEFIVYLSNQTTNRSNINGNINTHYGIY